MHKHLELPQPFAELGLETPLLTSLARISFREPTEIQRAMIPLVLAGRDVLGQARTGTGKTAAFGLPLLQRIDPQSRLQALMLAPTRELAAQVLGELRRFAGDLPVHCVPVYGGHGLRQQIHQLGRRPHITVGTPGRVLDLMRRKALDLGTLQSVVLDEVDRMLDIGFRDDIRKILGAITQPHQTIFVSATIGEEIKRLARQFMTDPVEVNVSRDELTVESVAQYYCTVDPWDKFRLLRAVLKQEEPRLIIVFTNTRHGARKLARRLFAAGVPAKEIHGDLVQQKREKIMERFRRHQIPVLVATDLASRGIDVSNITHILNYDVPADPDVYVHRIGRTARMGAFGKAITFVMRDQGKEMTAIEQLVNRELIRLEVPGFTPSPAPRGDGEAPVRERPLVAAAGPADEPPESRPRPATLGGKHPAPRRRRL